MGVTIDVTRPTEGGGGGGDVTSVFGRQGIVTAQNGDYNAGQISETATKKIMTDAERTKLAGLQNQQGVLTNYLSVQDLTTSTTNSTVGVSYINLTYPNAEIGEKYKVELSCSISHSATNSKAFIDLKDFGVSVLQQSYNVEPKDTTDREWVNLTGELLPNPLGGGQFQLQLDYGTTDNGEITTIYFGYLSIQKIN